MIFDKNPFAIAYGSDPNSVRTWSNITALCSAGICVKLLLGEMFFKKMAAAIYLIFVVIAAACFNSKPERYVITDSKSYEASLFRQNCAICHGPEAEGKTLDDGKKVPNLRDGDFKYKTDADIYRHISDGGNGMVPFRGQLTKREIDLLVNFVQNDLRGSPGIHAGAPR